jgi:tetratricopeptide (TPR) repeat protein
LLEQRALALESARTDEQRGAASAQLVALHLELAALCEEQLRDGERAAEHCRRALRIDPRQIAGAVRLERLARARGDADEALWALEHHLTDGVPRGDVARRLGLLLAALGRGEEAEPHLLASFAKGPSDAEVVDALAAILRERRDQRALADLLLRAGSSASAPERREAYAIEASRVLARLGDARTARQLLRRVLADAPAHPEVVEDLAADALRRGAFVEVLEVVGGALDATGASPPQTILACQRRARWHLTCAEASRALGSASLCLDHLLAAARVDPESLTALHELTDSLAAAGRWAEALPHLERLVLRDDSPRGGELGRWMLWLGRARAATGDRDGARRAFEHAAALGLHGVSLPPAAAQDLGREALGALVELLEQQGSFATAVVRRRERLALVTDREERESELSAIASLQARRLGDRAAAVATLEDGLVELPSARRLLHGRMDLAIAEGDLRRVGELLLRLGALTEGAERARYLATAGQLAERQGSRVLATSLYERALDADPSDLRTFTRLERVLTRARDPKAQERAYRRMLERHGAERVASSPQIRAQLWRGLGEILRSRLGDMQGAVHAFSRAAALVPNDLECQVIVAELCERGTHPLQAQALAVRSRLCAEARSPRELLEHLIPIFRLASSLGDGDRARLCAEALLTLPADTAAQADARAFLLRHPAPAVLPQVPLGEGAWLRALPKDAQTGLTPIFAAIGRNLLVTRSLRPNDRTLVGLPLHGAGQGQLQDQANDGSILARLLTQLATVLNFPRPHLVIAPEQRHAADFFGVQEKQHVRPTLVAGAELLRLRPKKELWTLVARTGALLRYEHLAWWPRVAPTFTELDLGLDGLRILCGLAPRNSHGRAHARAISRNAAFLHEHLSATELERAALVAREIDADATYRWLRGSILAANRAGLVVGGDLGAALRLVYDEQRGPVTVSSFEQTRDLVTFALSEEHRTTRRDLGLAPVPYGPAPRAVSPVSDDEVTQARIRPAALRRR